MNEVHIIAILSTIFVVIGFVLPFAQAEFTDSSNTYNTGGIVDELQQDGVGQSVSAGNVLTSVVKMFFWTFGDLPSWLDAFILLFRIVFWVAVVKLLPFT